MPEEFSYRPTIVEASTNTPRGMLFVLPPAGGLRAVLHRCSEQQSISAIVTRIVATRRNRRRTGPAQSAPQVEQAFAVMRLKFGFVKFRYCGLDKSANRLFVTCAVVTLFPVCEDYLLRDSLKLFGLFLIRLICCAENRKQWLVSHVTSPR